MRRDLPGNAWRHDSAAGTETRTGKGLGLRPIFQALKTNYTQDSQGLNVVSSVLHPKNAMLLTRWPGPWLDSCFSLGRGEGWKSAQSSPRDDRITPFLGSATSAFLTRFLPSTIMLTSHPTKQLGVVSFSDPPIQGSSCARRPMEASLTTTLPLNALAIADSPIPNASISPPAHAPSAKVLAERDRRLDHERCQVHALEVGSTGAGLGATHAYPRNNNQPSRLLANGTGPRRLWRSVAGDPKRVACAFSSTVGPLNLCGKACHSDRSVSSESCVVAFRFLATVVDGLVAIAQWFVTRVRSYTPWSRKTTAARVTSLFQFPSLCTTLRKLRPPDTYLLWHQSFIPLISILLCLCCCLFTDLCLRASNRSTPRRPRLDELCWLSELPPEDVATWSANPRQLSALIQTI